MSFTNNNRPLFQEAIEIQNSYEHSSAQPMDARCLVDKIDDLYNAYNWGSYVALTQQWSFKTFPGLIVGCLEDYAAYKLTRELTSNDVDENKRLPSSVWEKVATQEWVEEQGYGAGLDTSNLVTLDEFNNKVDVVKVSEAIATALAEAKQYADDNDANTTYGLEYDSASKTIKLVEKGVIQEIDATAFIKDGMLSSVVADQANNKLIFYWNTEAGIETTEVALSSIADIYTGKNGEEINVTVSNSNEITASLTETVKNNITQGVNAYNWGDHSAIGYLIPASTPLFDEDVIVEEDQDNFKKGDNLNGKTLPEIIAQLCGASLILDSIIPPDLEMGLSNQMVTVTNDNDYEVELVFTTNTWSGSDGVSKPSGAYTFETLIIPAHGSTVGRVDWENFKNLTVENYNIKCAFKYKKVYLSSSVSEPISG